MFKRIVLILLFVVVVLSNVFVVSIKADDIEDNDGYVMDGIYLNTYDEYGLRVGDTFKIDVYQRLTNPDIENEDERSIFGEKIEDAIFEVITSPANMAEVDSNGVVTALGKCYGAVVVYTSDYQFMTSCTIIIDDAVLVIEGWVEEDGKYYWIENERRVGTEGQGKFIYDPDSSSWYWLDASDNGARAENKEIYIIEKEFWIRALEDGKLARGWYIDKKRKQYFDLDSSRRYEGKENVEGQIMYFSNEDGYLLNKKWVKEKNKNYWIENGIKQGTYDDAACVIGDGICRGREIYDPASNGWYWLDSVYDGAKAEGKEVWIPYVYQKEDDWTQDQIEQMSYASDNGLVEYVYNAIKNKSGKWVRYDSNGKMAKGWYTVEGKEVSYYPDQKGNTYYYDTMTGIMAKGLVKIDGKEYYFDEITGVLSGKRQ